MTYVRFEPFSGIEKIGKKITELATDIEKGFSVEVGGFKPKVDIFEEDNKIYVHAEIAGLKKEDVKITVTDDRKLIIRGSKAKPERDESIQMIRTERVFGDFERTFILPENMDVDKIEAKFENGILELLIPRKEPVAPKEKEVSIT